MDFQRYRVCRLPTYQGRRGSTLGGRRRHLGWNLVSHGRKASSHRGHKTGVSVLDALTKGLGGNLLAAWHVSGTTV